MDNFVEVASAESKTGIIRFQPSRLWKTTGIDFAGDAKKIMDVLLTHCPVGTLVELRALLKEELGK